MGLPESIRYYADQIQRRCSNLLEAMAELDEAVDDITEEHPDADESEIRQGLTDSFEKYYD